MTDRQTSLLEFISWCGGEVDTYPIVEFFSAWSIALELVDLGLLERIEKPEAMDHFRLTEAGYAEVAKLENDS